MPPLTKETVAIPVVRGVELRSAARLVQAGSLLEAVNARLSGGSHKRYGHLEHRSRAGAYPAGATRPNFDTPVLTAYGAKVLDAGWLLGWGVHNDTSLDSAVTVAASFPTSEYPEAGYGLGIMRRDNELLTWNGTRLFSHADSQTITGQHGGISPAVLPVMRANQLAKSNEAQTFPDAADNGSVRFVTWLDATPQVRYSAFDSVRGAPLVTEAAFDFVDPYGARCFSLGNWFHVLCVEQDTGQLVLKSINQNNLDTYQTRSLGDCARYFDFWKIDETAAAVVINRDGTDVVLYFLDVFGGNHPSYTSNVSLDMDLQTIREISICSHPVSANLGIANVALLFDASYEVQGVVVNTEGVQQGTRITIEVISPSYTSRSTRLTIAPRFIDADSNDLFDVYYSHSDSTTGPIRRGRFSQVEEFAPLVEKWHLQVASHGFRVGDRTYVWASYTSTLQSTWFLLDENLDPVGKLAFSVANTPGYAQSATADISLASVNWRLHDTLQNQAVVHLALGYRERVAATDDPAELANLYAEPGIQFAELDFLPRLRSAQAGRSTYIAGAQLWAYDGEELVEAGFHIAPELFSVPTQDTSGSLTQLGSYSYRADLCYRNAQNEEVRSHSLIFDSVVLTGTNDRITLVFKTAITRRTNAYILIFRNAMEVGSPTSTWSLLNSRDPSSASFLPNTQASKTVTYIDDGTITDAQIVGREGHPGNSGTYLQPFAAPACEVIGAGKDRLWVAGGELPPGQIAPSRYFFPGHTPAFNANVNIQVDRNSEPITALGFLGDVAVVFRRTQTYLQDGDGPDNEANGYWPTTRLGLADSGAISQESLALIAPGLLYQSPAGFRIINAAGGLVNRSQETSGAIGAPVDAIAKTFDVAGAVVVPADQEVRWYGPTGAIVYNYLEDCWSTWTCPALGAATNLATGRAALAYPQGALWLETEDVWRDGDRLYEHRIRFPWLHGGALGDFQRVRRIAGFGTWDSDNDAAPTHRVRVEMFYDERDFPEEYWEWAVPDDSQNEDTWGSGDWGDGVWGDAGNATLEDSVWRFRRRPARQKCSVFSVSISDLGSDGPGFTLVVLALELARKPGLDRIPAVTGGNSTNSRG